jgi:hypothetical protein
MKDRRPDPGVEARKRPDDIIPLHGMRIRDLAPDFGQPADVRPKVEERERDGGRLLHPRQSPERPFSVVLVDSIAQPDIPRRDIVHTRVFAVVFAGPASEAQRDGKRDVVGKATPGTPTTPQAVFEFGGPIPR